jgi:hypothetical protein
MMLWISGRIPSTGGKKAKELGILNQKISNMFKLAAFRGS